MTDIPFDERRKFMNAAWDGDAAGLNAFLDKYPGGQECTRGEPIGYTALLWAAQSGNADSIRVLLDRGAKIDNPDRDGITPLMHAASRGHLGAVHLLLARGADVTLRDNRDRSALDIARKEKKDLSAKVIEDAVAAREKAIAEAERAADETLHNAERNFQDSMRAIARSGRFRLRKGPA